MAWCWPDCHNTPNDLKWPGAGQTAITLLLSEPPYDLEWPGDGQIAIKLLMAEPPNDLERPGADQTAITLLMAWNGLVLARLS